MKLTSVKVDPQLYTAARHKFLETNLSFQKFVNRALFLFNESEQNSEQLLNVLDDYTDLGDISGSM